MSKNFKILALLAAVLILLIFLNIRGLLDSPKNFLFTVFSPINNFFSVAGRNISSGLDFLVNFQEIKRQNHDFESERNRLLSEIVRLKEAEKENMSLRELLNLQKEDAGKNFILADIVGFNLENFQDSVLINKGVESGVEINAPVLAGDNRILGRVKNVYADFSEVETIFSQFFSVAAMDQETGAKGIVRGWFSNELLFDTVLKEDALNEGDMIVTSGLDNIYQAGVLAGKIKRIDKKDIDVFQRAYIEPLVNLRNIESVFVVVDKNNQPE